MVNFVDAIENGRIVKVAEDYARMEGLLIVRRQNDAAVSQVSAPSPTFIKHESKRLVKDFTLDKMRKPLGYYKNNIVADLVDNFHWEISKARKIRNVTRKQVALSIGESEETVKMMENGIVPSDNYIIVNKLQSYFGINLRKDGKTFSAPKVEGAGAARTPSWVKQEDKPFISKEDEKRAEEEKVRGAVAGEDIEVFGEDN